MKNLLTHFSKIRGYFSASQGNDVGYDCRLTVVRPSFDCRSTVLKLCSVLVVLLTVGVGNAWGTTYTYDFHSCTASSGGAMTYWYSDAGCKTHVSKFTTGTTNQIISSGGTATIYYKDASIPSTAFTISAGNTAYFMAGSSASTSFFWGKTSGNYITLPTYSGEVITKVKVTTSSGVGKSIEVNIYSGTNAASTSYTTTGCTPNGCDNTQYNEFDISSTYQSSSLKLQIVTDKKNFQITEIQITTASACTPLGSINGSVNWTNPTTAVLTWDNVAHVTSWTAKWKTGAGSYATTNVSAITTNGAGKKTCTVTGLSCNTDYDFKIIATPADGYCNKEQEIANQNSGKWDVTYTLSNASISSGQSAGTGVLCGDLDVVFAATSGYVFPNSITVEGASSHTWTKASGTLHVDAANITGNVTVTITATAGSTWKFKYSGDSYTEHTMTESAGVASYSISLAADSRFNFCIDDNGTAYKNNGTIVTTTSGWVFNTSDGNCNIHTGPAGTYTFAINTTTKAVTVTYPDVTHPNDHYVYFKNTSVWPTVKGYLGNTENDNKAAPWPGSDMQATTTICGELYHYAALNAMSGTYNLIIFNNGNSGPGNQSWNLSTSGSLGKFNANTDGDWHAFKYTISFAGNGNTDGSMSDISNICIGSNQALTSNAFSKDYYTFAGWHADVDVKVGESTISAGDMISNGVTIKDIQSNITLEAQWSVIPVTGLTLNYSSLKKYVGESSVTLSVASVTPGTANPAVTWTSSDATVASVDGGVVSFLKAGTATITATSTVSGGVTATCSVEVRSISSPTMKDEDGTSISGSGLSATWTLGTRTLTASEGTSKYKFKRWVVTNATPASTTNLSTTLGDPTGNVTVVAEFYKPRTVTKGTGTGTSTFTVSPTGEVKYGTSVTVTCAAADGYKNPWTLTVTPSDGATYDETGSTGSITVSNITKNITIDLEYTDRGCTDHGASSITTGTDHNNYQAPINNNWNYGVRQILYTKEDLSLTTGKKGTIKSISFKYNYSSAMTKKDNVKIYMANTTLSSLSNTAGNYVPFSEFTEVYSGSLNCSTGWNEFILTTPFVYYSNKNLVVLIDDNSGDYDGSSYDFYVHSASGKQLYKTSDDSHLDPASAATWTGGTAADYRPHTDFCLQEGDMSQYTVTWHVGESTSTTSNVYEGTTFSSLSGSQPAHADNALAACGSTKFIGWVSADGEWNEDGKTVDWYNSYKIADNYQITGNTDFYAMYAEGSGGGSTTKSYGWEASESDASSWTISGPSQSSNQHNTGSYSGYINTNNTYVTFNEKVNVTEFSFYFTRTSDNNNYNVYIETSANGSDWSAAATFAMNSFATSVSWKKCSKTWDGETAYYVRFHCNNTTAVRYVDDVSITYESTSYSNYRTGCSVSCSRPTPATPASITKTGATISWIDPATSGTLDHYEYKVWADGDDEPVSGTSNSTNLSKALTGLYSGVTYHWKVRRVCTGEDASIWASGSDFTTTDATITFSVPTGVDPVSSSTTASNLPEAGVATDCGNCWEFAGWTAITSYSDDDAPVDLMPSGTKAKVSGDKTLYAVYASGSTYKRVSEASELTPATYLVTFTSLGQVYALSSDVHSKYATDAVAYNIQSTIEKIGDDFYSIEPKPAYTWTFAGTSSAGTLYNAVGNKYINMSTTTILQASSGNMAFAFSDADSTWTVKSTSYYLHGYVSTSYGTYPGFEATSGSNSVQLYKRVVDSYATSPDCSKYTVTWDINNGATTSTTNVTKCQGYLASLPSAPADNTLVSCIPSDGKFVGWSANKVMPATDTRPSDLFADKEDAPEITDDITFYAVFAHETAGGEAATNTTYTFTSKSWGDATSSWNSTTDGDELTSGRGIKVLGDESAVGVTKNNFKAVTKVVVTYCTNASSGAGSIAVSVGETSYGSNTISKPSSGGTTLKTFEYTHDATTGTVTINASATANSIYIYSVQIFYTGATTTYEGYRTACCNDPQLKFLDGEGDPTTEYVIVREDLASASAGVTIGCDISSLNTTGAISWTSTHRDKNDYASAYTWSSSQPVNLNIDIANEEITAKETGVWQITISQAAGATTYCPEDATVTVRVKTIDKFIDAVNGNFSGEAQRLEDTGNGILLPTEATFSTNNGCADGTERRLIGWIKASDLATYASGRRVNTIDDLKTGDASNKVIAPGTKVQATGVTWYAVWGVEK